jgi:hypothetical protein
MASVQHNYGVTAVAPSTTPAAVAIGTQGNPNWGSTFLGDLVTKVNFGAYVREQVYGSCRWVQSGIIQRNTTLDLSAGGTRITVPYFKPFLATEEVIESNTAWGASAAGYLSSQKINADSQVAAVMHRGFAWSSDDLSRLGAGADPMAAIASYIGDSVLRNRTATLKAMLDGVLGVAGLASHTVSVARTAPGASAEGNFISAANVIKASTVLGENSGLLTNIAMHSHVYAMLKTLGMLTFSTSALSTGGNVAWGGGGVGITSTQVANFAGFNVIVDDQLAPTTSAANGDKYPVYLFGSGAVQQGIQQDFRVEYERNILSKQDIASCDYHQLLHIDGVSYTGTDNPTNTVLSTAGSWALKYDHRQIPVVKLEVNSAFAANP